MRVPKRITDNIAFVFFNSYLAEDTKEAVLPVIKNLDFDYNFEKGELIYEGCSPSLVYDRDDWQCLGYIMSSPTTLGHIDFYKDMLSKYHRFNNVMTPYKLSPLDIECIEDILNSGTGHAADSMLDALGYVVREECEGVFRLHFVGGPIHELWKEVYNESIEPWNYDIEEGAIDWKTGNDWNDGLDLEKDIPKNWLEMK